jgi:hypothetical protein
MNAIQQAIEAMEGFLAIVNDSRGVAGYHLNGDAAEWDEFDEVEAAEAAIAALKAHQSQPVGQWMPIETAPKDGTRFLAYFNHMCVEAWYSQAWEMFLNSKSKVRNPINPSHWMPLPAAPGSQPVVEQAEASQQAVPQGFALVSIAQLSEWKQRVNTLACQTLRRDRHTIGAELKTEIADVIAAPLEISNELAAAPVPEATQPTASKDEQPERELWSAITKWHRAADGSPECFAAANEVDTIFQAALSQRPAQQAEAPVRCAPCRSTGVFHCAHPDECGGPWTGNAEADRLIGRLLSSDPDFDDCTDAAELIRKLATQPTQAEAPRTPTLAECGETLGAPHPDWPAWCTTFRERLAYQHGVADARATQPTASKDEPSEADYAFDDLNLRLIEVTEERDHLRAALSQRPAQQAEVFPVILFQGHAIYAALSPQAKARTSAENVADVLDAAVAVLRQRRAALSQRGGAA